MIHKTHFEISKIVDGDDLIVKNIFTEEEIEIRFYGIDAPEMKRCKKLFQDEKETHIAGYFLIELGIKATRYLRKIASIGTACTILQEENNTTDIYERNLAYIILPDGSSLNEKMIRRRIRETIR